MAYKSILTNDAKVSSIEQFYYSPVAVVPPNINVPLGTTYCVLAKNDPWPDNEDPPQPTQDQLSIKSFLKKIFVAKRITPNDISPILERIDWSSGTVYEYYRDDVNMFEVDSNGFLIKKFYIKNQYDQVFKCLWNNNGAQSLIEPYFQPGTYNTSNIFQSTDGYKWKYIYTIDIGPKVKFMDSNWIPVPVGLNAPSSLTPAGSGNIDVINVTNGGSGYDLANALITVTITGDGTGAAGSAQVDNGVITDIIVTNAGTNYTYANVTISSAQGSNATAIAPTSPIGGHGYDPMSELGCSKVMIVAEFNGSENGAIPTDIDYHQIGLVVNPVALDTEPNPANNTIYKTTTDLVVAAGFGLYTMDELVYQGPSLEAATFVGSVLSFDPASNVVKLINTTGTLVTNASLFGNDSKTTRTLLTFSTPKFVTTSGYVTFIENRSSIQRSDDGIEQFKFVLGF